MGKGVRCDTTKHVCHRVHDNKNKNKNVRQCFNEGVLIFANLGAQMHSNIVGGNKDQVTLSMKRVVMLLTPTNEMS